MCLASFASEYRIVGTNENCANKVKLDNDLGSVVRRTRTQPAVVRYANFSVTKCPEKFYQSHLQLFLPHHIDVQLKPPGYAGYEEFYNTGHVNYIDGFMESVKAIVDRNRNKFEKDADVLHSARQDLDEGLVEDAWCQLCPEQQLERLECEQVFLEQPLLADEHVEIIPDLVSDNQRCGHFEKRKNVLCRNDGLALLRTLNDKQLSVFYQIRQWCLDKIQGKTPPPFHVFLTGGAGTGKSHLIKAVSYEANRLLSELSHHPDDICVLLTAPTGIAAYNLHASTVHHALSIGIDTKLPYTPLGEEKLNTLRATLGRLHILVIDEISMVDHKLLMYIHGRLRQIKQTGNFSPFGNVSIIAVGDFFQLPPVRGKPLYIDNDGVNLWTTHFSVVELSTIVRQNNIAFAEMLNRLRTRKKKTPLLHEDISLLRGRETGEQSSALHLFPTNVQVNEHNMKQLIQCCDEYVTVKAQDYKKEHKSGKMVLKHHQHSRVHNSCLQEVLYLGHGARVMLMKNIDVADGLVNGVCGTVIHVACPEQKTFPDTVYVQFDDDHVEERVDNKGGLRRQFPLKLAWGITIHKVQGLTLDEAIVSLKKVFAAGQAYVAISRVKSLEGLIIQDFNEKFFNISLMFFKKMLLLEMVLLPSQP
uniref:ATP-dependent DNA helicase n=1 Tax=Scophthalmus maximus TaxID=52904 RepID=A0A8D3EBL6_SCOMX